MNQINQPLIISIITPSYNQGDFIEETIKSVLVQEGNFYIDYIIMDGGSKDQSVDIITKYENLLKDKSKFEIIDGILFYISTNKESDFNKCRGISYRWVSGKDDGQADAINKGINKSVGQVIGWLNSDDIYYKDVFKIIIMQNFEEYDFFYGKAMWISKMGKTLLPYPTYEPTFYSFYYQCTLCQPAVFFTKKAVLQIGLLDNSYYCGFDFEYWMRALFNKKRFFYLDSFIAKSRMYMENKSLANQNIVKNDINRFKQKYYEKLELNQDRIAKYQYINDETNTQVKKLNHKIKNGERINLLFDATVLINDLNNDSGRSGIFFVALNVLKYLMKNSEINVSLFCYKDRVPLLKKVLKQRFGSYDFLIVSDMDLISKKTEIITNIQDIDVFFSPIFKIPQEIKDKNYILKYTILYDVIMIMFPEYFPIKQKWLSEMIEEINNNDHYFAISESTKNDFIANVPSINPNNISVTPLAASDNFYCNNDYNEKERVFKKYNILNDKKYIFSLCTLEPRKNLIMSVKCFIKFIDKNKITDLVFLLGGSHWEGFIEKLNKEIKNLDEYKDKIIRVGYIKDEDLSVFYSFSEFFVYPSLYEGFGLPVLEAMKCGIPVITSNNSSLPEVIGDAGLMVDPKSEKEIIDAFENLYFNHGLRTELSKKGIERAHLFSWEKTVNLMVNEILVNLKDHVYEINKDEKVDFKVKYNLLYFIKSIKNYLNSIFYQRRESCFSVYRKLPLPIKNIYRFLKSKINL